LIPDFCRSLTSHRKKADSSTPTRALLCNRIAESLMSLPARARAFVELAADGIQPVENSPVTA
jgi:hypothetical protein